jgi:hypothetical protein
VIAILPYPSIFSFKESTSKTFMGHLKSGPHLFVFIQAIHSVELFLVHR